MEGGIMMTEMQSTSEEDTLIKQSTEEAYGLNEKFKISKRDWNPQKIPQYQLPEYLKIDPVLFQFFRRLHYQDKNFIALVVGDPGCQPIGSKVLLSDGSWKNIELIKKKDEVICYNFNGMASTAKVKNIHKQFSKYIYTIYEKRTQRELYSCAGNHMVPFKSRRGKNVFNTLAAEDLYKIVNDRMTIKSGVYINKFANSSKKLILDPYFLGAWLGDGYSGNTNNKSYYVRITSANKNIIKKIESIYGKMDRRATQSPITYQYYYRKRNNIGKSLEILDLHNKNCYTKFIPNEYKYSGIKNRLQILSGLIDTDGCVDKTGRIFISTTSIKMANDIIFMVNSLGGRAVKHLARKGKYTLYRVNINLGSITNKLNLQHERKKKRLKLTSHKKDPTYVNFFLTRKKSNQLTIGIEIDKSEHTYITDNFCVTNNSGKSCTAISLARALDITPLGNGEFKRNFIIKSAPDGKGSPETRVVFGPSQFMQLIKSGLPKGSIIIWDEAGIGQDATQWNDKKSRLIKHVMQTFRSRNYGLFMTVPDKESVTLSTRRLVHCYIDVSKRDKTHAYLDIRWLNRVRGSEKTVTYYKYPVFRDPVTGKLKKVVKYKVPKVDPIVEKVYNRIKDNTLQDIYDYYQKELEFMEKELGESTVTDGADTAIKLIKFNMATATNIAKIEIDNIRDDDLSFNSGKIMLVLAQKGLQCTNSQAKLIADVLKTDKTLFD